MNSVLIGSEAHLVAQESNPPERYFWGTSNDLLTIPNLTIAECRGYGVDFPVVPNAVSEFDVGRIWSDQMPMGANSRISADEGSTVDVRGFNRVLVSNSGAGRQNIDTLIGIPGQVVTLVFQDSGSSIQDSGVGSGNIKLASGAAFDPDLDDTLQLVVQSATAVLEIARSDN